jgi:hypothetical protein
VLVKIPSAGSYQRWYMYVSSEAASYSFVFCPHPARLAAEAQEAVMAT